MAHMYWCGKSCADCASSCALDQSIPCSPDCPNLSPEGALTAGCKGCEVADRIKADNIVMMRVYTVSITDLEDPYMDIWTSSFSTKEKAFDYMDRIKQKLASVKIDTVRVSFDAGRVNDTSYLDWLDERYSEEDSTE